MHTILRCSKPSCSSVFGVLPGAWKVGRMLGRGETAAPGHGAIACPGCRTKYEVTPTRKAA